MARSFTTPIARRWKTLTAMPWATKIYKRDLDVTKYNVPFLLHPYIALYSTRGCPAQCTFCLWPQTLSGHAWRKRSTDDVAAELKWAKENFPHVKEFFFDDDTFNIQKVRTIELCEKLKPLGLTWSCTSRVTTDHETLKAMKDAGCRLLIVGISNRATPRYSENIKKGATVERARAFAKDCNDLRPCGSRRLHPRPSGRDQGVDPQHDQLRQDPGLRDDPSVHRARVPKAPSSTITRRSTVLSPTRRWKTGAVTRWRTLSIPACPSTT